MVVMCSRVAVLLWHLGMPLLTGQGVTLCQRTLRSAARQYRADGAGNKQVKERAVYQSISRHKSQEPRH